MVGLGVIALFPSLERVDSKQLRNDLLTVFALCCVAHNANGAPVSYGAWQVPRYACNNAFFEFNPTIFHLFIQAVVTPTVNATTRNTQPISRSRTTMFAIMALPQIDAKRKVSQASFRHTYLLA